MVEKDIFRIYAFQSSSAFNNTRRYSPLWQPTFRILAFKKVFFCTFGNKWFEKENIFFETINNFKKKKKNKIRNKLRMRHNKKHINKNNNLGEEKILHTGDIKSLDQCG